MTPGHLQMRPAYSFDTSKVSSPAISVTTLSSRSVFSYSFLTAFISTSIISHTVRFHLVTSTYTVKLVAGTIL